MRRRATKAYRATKNSGGGSEDDTNSDHTPGGEGSDSKSWWRYPKAGSWKAKPWNPKGGWHSQHNQGVASSDPWSNTAWKKRKREPTSADFGNSGQWSVFEEVNMAPGWNAGVLLYGKENLSKEDAIEAAKQACKKNGHIGLVVVGLWEIFYKRVPDVGKPSLKWVNKGTHIETHFWLTKEQLEDWNRRVMKKR